jgi:hypothetical protein
MMLPTLHHTNQSRNDYQTITGMDQADSRLNKSRLLDYSSYTSDTNSNQYKANQNKTYGHIEHGHLPNIKQND